jgi:hypothetical protein
VAVGVLLGVGVRVGVAVEVRVGVRVGKVLGVRVGLTPPAPGVVVGETTELLVGEGAIVPDADDVGVVIGNSGAFSLARITNFRSVRLPIPMCPSAFPFRDASLVNSLSNSWPVYSKKVVKLSVKTSL